MGTYDVQRDHMGTSDVQRDHMGTSDVQRDHMGTYDVQRDHMGTYDVQRDDMGTYDAERLGVTTEGIIDKMLNVVADDRRMRLHEIAKGMDISDNRLRNISRKK
ncbi:hypothetical protein AVEN_86826-1 [Araneus ventricosus]|uniref:Uncharacterized protein n=1 Tax=Araneus ventricosus TaxID=182803 RepID=A0A4Y2D1F2_ARAVE|nr:hypothetical protein AVEN_86826-1 [Araneus ventricosus]